MCTIKYDTRVLTQYRKICSSNSWKCNLFKNENGNPQYVYSIYYDTRVLYSVSKLLEFVQVMQEKKIYIYIYKKKLFIIAIREIHSMSCQ